MVKFISENDVGIHFNFVFTFQSLESIFNFMNLFLISFQPLQIVIIAIYIKLYDCKKLSFYTCKNIKIIQQEEAS